MIVFFNEILNVIVFNNTALSLAVIRNDIEMVDYLLMQENVDVNIKIARKGYFRVLYKRIGLEIASKCAPPSGYCVKNNCLVSCTADMSVYPLVLLYSKKWYNPKFEKLDFIVQNK